MSRHEQVKQFENLVKRSYSWHGRDGKLSYLNDDGDWVDVGEKFPFLLIESGCFSITGKEALDSDRRVKSNMGHQSYSTDLTVKWKDTGDVIATGTWGAIKRDVQAAAKNAKWTSNLYILFKDGSEYQIGKLMLKGRAVSTWMDFAKKNSSLITRNPIFIEGSNTYKDTKNGMDSEIPNFVIGSKGLSPEADKVADAAYEEVHSFLKDYFARLTNGEDVDAPADAADRHMTSGGTEEKPAGAGGDPFDEPLPVTNGTETTDDGDLPF